MYDQQNQDLRVCPEIAKGFPSVLKDTEILMKRRFNPANFSDLSMAAESRPAS